MTQYHLNAEDIIFEDNIFVVVNKPQGLPTQGTSDSKTENLYSMLQEFLNQREGRDIYLALHHRLDAATSGLVMFCKNKTYNKFVTDLFREKIIKKTYLAIVETNDKVEINSEWTVHNFIKTFQVKHFKKAKSAPKGEEAITHFKLLIKKSQTALIECTPETGRLHQIRVHLSEDKLPIVGDFHYNKKKATTPLMLHAYKLTFPHPRRKKQTIEVVAPLPEHFFIRLDS